METKEFEESEESGQFRDIEWSFDSGTLTISGTGDLPNYDDICNKSWDHLSAYITEVIIKGGVTRIRDYAFNYCENLVSVTIPDSVTAIGDYAFYSCDKLTSIKIPDSVTAIGDYAFAICGLTLINIPNSVITIGRWAFYACCDLTSITIGDSVTTIGYMALHGCSRLTNVRVLRAIPPSMTYGTDTGTDTGTNTFGNPFGDATLYVPKGSEFAYRSAEGWNKFGTIVEMEN
jgi:hypothetical protein